MKVSSRQSGAVMPASAARRPGCGRRRRRPAPAQPAATWYLRLLLIERSGGTGDADARARELVGIPLSELAALARRFGEIDFTIKHAPYPQLPLEVALVEAVAIASPDPAASSLAGEQAVEHPSTDAVASSPPRPTSLRTVFAPLRDTGDSETGINPVRSARTSDNHATAIDTGRRSCCGSCAAWRWFVRHRAHRESVAECTRRCQSIEPAHRGVAE